MWEYIEATRDQVRDMERRVRLAKGNVEAMVEIMLKWSEQPLYQRKEDKKGTLLNLDDRENKREARYGKVTEGAEKIHALLKENLEYFQADPDSPAWHRYMEYIDDIVLDGLFNCVHCSLRYWLDNTDKHKTAALPFMEVKLELQSPDMVFNPTLDQDASHGYVALVEGLLDDAFKFASLVPRIAPHRGSDNYQEEVEELAELCDMKEEIMSRVNTAVEQAMEHRNSFDNYGYLWVDDRTEFMAQFLKYGHVLTAEEIEQAGDEGVPESPPTLTQFKGQVDSYEKVYTEVVKFQVCQSHYYLFYLLFIYFRTLL